MVYSKNLFKILQFMKFMFVFSFENCFYHGQWGDLELFVIYIPGIWKIELIFQFLFIIVLVQGYSELRILNCSWILALYIAAWNPPEDADADADEYADADRHPHCGCGCGSSMSGSIIHFLFTFRMRMRIEYELGLRDKQKINEGSIPEGWRKLQF